MNAIPSGITDQQKAALAISEADKARPKRPPLKLDHWFPPLPRPEALPPDHCYPIWLPLLEWRLIVGILRAAAYNLLHSIETNNTGWRPADKESAINSTKVLERIALHIERKAVLK